MKLLMITNEDISNKSNIGIFNKMFGQAKAFCSYGVETHFIYNKFHFLILDKLVDNVNSVIRPSSTKDYYDRILHLIISNNYQVIYIRYPLSNYYFLNFSKSIKEINPKIKLIIEFPTYPYDQELTSENILNIDKFFREYLNKFIDFGVCYNNFKSIFSIPVLSISNGINLNIIPLREELSSDSKSLNLIAVANLSKWHGYDRLILSLHNYYKTENTLKVYFHIVGEGSELINLRNLTNKLNLKEYVIFHGVKKGAELNKLFDNSKLAIGSLGMHRIGLQDGSTLKAREYCARGIPFIIGYEDIDFPKNFKYVLRVSNDNSMVDINILIDFYFTVYKNRNIAEDMRKYAEDNLSWEAKLKVIIEKLIE